VKNNEAFKGRKETFPVPAGYDNFSLILFIPTQVTASPFPRIACPKCS